jgi:hypothetical protein
LNGEELIGEQSPQIPISALGIYTVSVNVNGCNTSLSQGYEVSSVGFADHDSGNIRVYSDALGSLRIENWDDEVKGIELFDLSGRIIDRLDRTSNAKLMSLSYNHELPEGIYLIRVQMQQSTKVHKIVLRH